MFRTLFLLIAGFTPSRLKKLEGADGVMIQGDSMFFHRIVDYYLLPIYVSDSHDNFRQL